ncbi:MAG: helix-turn-helix domain-containing protein [Pseudonocardiaceae bacterium]
MTEDITRSGITGSTVPRRQLGRYLRDLRKGSRLTALRAATQLEWTEAKIWRIETGRTGMRSLDVEAMRKIYGAPPELTTALMALAKETKARGWWHAYGDVIPEGFDLYIGLEEAASHLAVYQSELVPGLLQTEDYARSVIRANKPGVDDAEIERRVSARMARQVLLTRVTAPTVLDVVLNEAVLRRPVGSAKIMQHQLERLKKISELPTVSLKVMPFSVGLHPGALSGPFAILRFPLKGTGPIAEPPTVYIDGLTGALYLDKPHEVDQYADKFASMWESALDEKASQRLIGHVAKELQK